MRIMKRTVLSLFLLACLLVTSIGLTACGKDEYDDGFWLLTEDISKYASLKADDYKKAVLTIDPVDEVTMEEVEKYIRNAQIEAYKDKLVTVNTGTVQDEDTVILWYRGEVNLGTDAEPNWVEFLGGSNYNSSAYSLRIGSGNFIPGFEDALIGLNIAETNINVVKGANKQVGVAGDIVYISYKYTSVDENGKTKSGTMTDRVDLRKDADGNYIGVSRYSKALRDALDGLYVKDYIKKDGQIAKFTESFDMTQDLKNDTVTVSNVQVIGIVSEENVKMLEVAFPTPYTNNENLAGKKARWFVAVDEIQRLPEDAPTLEEADYSFISSKLGIKYDSILALATEQNAKMKDDATIVPVLSEAEISEIGSDKTKQEAAVVAHYKEYLLAAMKEKRESTIATAIQSAFWEYIVEKIEVKQYPEGLVEQYIEAMRASARSEFDSYTQTEGSTSIATLEQYLVNYYDAKYFPSVDKIEEGFELMAKEQLRSEMALYYIAAAERLTMSKSERDKTAEEEMAALIEYYTAYYQSTGQLSENESFTEQDMANAGITKRSLVENVYLKRVNDYIATTLREYVQFKAAE